MGMADGDDEHTTGPAPADDKVVRGIRFVTADPQVIFDLLADPSKHALIDGSGTVRSPSVDSPERLTLGAKFGMSMKQGVPYTTKNEVVEFEEPTLIAWRHIGKHVWRYRLRPVAGGTEVTEECDWGASWASMGLKLSGAPKRNRKAIDATLDRLAAHFADAS